MGRKVKFLYLYNGTAWIWAGQRGGRQTYVSFNNTDCMYKHKFGPCSCSSWRTVDVWKTYQNVRVFLPLQDMRCADWRSDLWFFFFFSILLDSTAWMVFTKGGHAKVVFITLWDIRYFTKISCDIIILERYVKKRSIHNITAVLRM